MDPWDCVGAGDWRDPGTVWVQETGGTLGLWKAGDWRDPWDCEGQETGGTPGTVGGRRLEGSRGLWG